MKLRHKSDNVWTTETNEHGQRVHVLRCRTCDAVESIVDSSVSTCPPEMIEKKFTRKGWNFWKSRCPECAKKRPAVAVETEEQNQMAAVVPLVAPSTAVATVREPTIKETVRISQVLDSCFDQIGGQYTKGKSDRHLSEELNLPMMLITKVREALGYVIKVDPEIVQLSADLAAAQAILDDLRQRLDKLLEGK